MSKIICLVILFIINGCNIFEVSENKIISEYYNPKGSLKVIVFVKQGNATVQNSVQVLLEGYDYKLKSDDIGNIFIAEKGIILDSTNDSSFKAKWIDNETIELYYNQDFRVFKREDSFQNVIGKVKINYVKIE